MKKRDAKHLIIICLLIIILNIFLIFSFGRLNDSFFTGFASLGEFFSGFFKIIHVGQVFINILFQVNIHSPLNQTYNFSKGENYTIGLNVSSNKDIAIWWYTLKDLKHNIIVNNSIIFVPNTTINAVRWSNELIVYGNDSSNNIFNNSVVFFVYIPNSAPAIEYIAPQIFVCENNYLSYYFNVTDVDEDTPSASISPSNPFYIAFSSNINLTKNKYEIYSGTLSKAQAEGVNAGWKIYEENVSVNDGIYADSKQTNITVIEINRAPAIENIGVKTIWGKGDNRTFYHQVKVTDTEDGNQDSGNLTFNITILNYTGSVVNLFNISSNGIMNFTANLSYLGIYNITIYVTDKGIRNPHPNISLCGQDGSNITSTEYFSLTVTSENRAPTIVNYYPTNLTVTVNEGESLYFNISGYDPDGTIPDAYWYFDDSLVEYDEGNPVNEFTYTFDYNSAGNHTIIGKITDGILSVFYDYITWNITVLNVEPPTVPPAGGGGGGGVAKPVCEEKWGCDNWNTCQNAEKSLEAGILSGEDYRSIKEKCLKNKWDEEYCGFQIRNCFDVNICNTTKKRPLEIQECYYTEKPNCYDNIKNCHDGACEILVDCGGPCPSCPTCSDKIQNQGEEGIDCGGPCPLCPIEKPLDKNLYLIYILISLIVGGVIVIIIKTVTISKLGKKHKKLEKIKG